MQNPVHISFRGIESTPAIDEYVRKRAAKLDTFSDRIIRCRVTVEAPHQHRVHGRTYRIGIDLMIPGAELFVGRSPDEDPSHKDVYAAIDDAFDDAGRVLQEHMRRRRGDIKTHEEPEVPLEEPAGELGRPEPQPALKARR